MSDQPESITEPIIGWDKRPYVPVEAKPIVITLPPNVTEVLVRGVLIGDEAVEVDVRTLANEAWTPIALRGGDFEVRDA